MSWLVTSRHDIDCMLNGQLKQYLNKSPPGIKKECWRTKKALLEKVGNRNGRPMLPAFDRIKILIIMTSLQSIVILSAHGLLMLMGSKILIKMTRPQNIKMKEQCFTAWSSLSKILIPSTSGDLEHPK